MKSKLWATDFHEETLIGWACVVCCRGGAGGGVGGAVEMAGGGAGVGLRGLG